MEQTQNQSAAGRPSGVKHVSSQDLLQDQKELIIVHNEQEYRLRATRNGKLILTK